MEDNKRDVRRMGAHLLTQREKESSLALEREREESLEREALTL